MKIAIRNPERSQWMSGYGVINRALQPLSDVSNPADADVHLFASPPYSFLDLDPSKFNVGLTMTERHDLKSYKWHGKTFPQFANQMDLLIAPGQWCHDVFVQQLTPPVEIVKLGHDHAQWRHPIRDTANRSVFILDRGRDRPDSVNLVADYFEQINYLDCHTPKPRGAKQVEIIKRGRFTQQEIFGAYKQADVFFKWGREGWCFPILEAMSAGCLVITNCVHLPYLEPDRNCLVFRDMPQLKAALSQAERHPLTELKRAGQRTAESLTWDNARGNLRAAIKLHFTPSTKD